MSQTLSHLKRGETVLETTKMKDVVPQICSYKNHLEKYLERDNVDIKVDSFNLFYVHF